MVKKGKPPKRQKRLAGGPPKLSAYNRFVKRFMKGRKGKATANMKAAARAWNAQGKKPKATRAAPKRAAPKRRAPAKKGGIRRVAKFNQQKLFKLIRMAGLLAPAAMIATGAGSAESKIVKGIQAYTGYDAYNRKWKPESLIEGYGGLLGASLATYGIPKLVGLLRGI